MLLSIDIHRARLYGDIALQFILETNSLEITRKRAAKLNIISNISRNKQDQK